MEEILELARDMGHLIQEDERFIKTQMAQAAADDDKELQEAIGKFNLKRMALQGEANKADKDEAKITALNEELRGLYTAVMGNAHMEAYQAAKSELDKMVNEALTIVSLSAQGADPDTAGDSGCSGGGGCAGCNGCH